MFLNLLLKKGKRLILMVLSINLLRVWLHLLHHSCLLRIHDLNLLAMRLHQRSLLHRHHLLLIRERGILVTNRDRRTYILRTRGSCHVAHQASTILDWLTSYNHLLRNSLRRWLGSHLLGNSSLSNRHVLRLVCMWSCRARLNSRRRY